MRMKNDSTLYTRNIFNSREVILLIVMETRIPFLMLFIWIMFNPLSAQFDSQNNRVKGFSWIGSDSIIASSFTEIKEIKGNWISLVAYGDMYAYNDPIVKERTEHDWWGDSDEGIITTARLAKEQGIRVMLKPHLVLPNNLSKWRHDIEMDNKEDWEKWFLTYEQWIMSYAELAEENYIDMLSIGTELYQATTKYPNQWRQLIDKVRGVYLSLIHI